MAIAGDELGKLVFDNIHFEYDGTNGNAFNVAAASSASSVTVKNCIFDGYAKSIWYDNAGLTTQSLLLSNNRVVNHGTGQGVIDIRKGSCTSLTIEQCTITGGRDLIRADANTITGAFTFPNNNNHISKIMTTENRKTVIELQDVKRDFIVGNETVHALRGVSFKIHEGEFVTIMGKSGSGKSTLLNQLGCLDTPTSGEYLLDGISVRTMSRSQRAVLRNRKIGFIFQNYNLLPKTTSVENVELPLMYNAEVTARERQQRAIDALTAVGLGERLYHKSNQMSGGQMQRVAIARALVNNPAVILADEATGNLDTRTSFEILVLFQKLHAQGRTIIFVTHNPDIANYSSRNIQLRDGRVISDEQNTNILSAAEGLAALPAANDE